MERGTPVGTGPPAGLRVALVTPFDWGIPCAVNQHVADLARYLVGAGHRPTVVGSSSYAPEVRRMRPLLRRRDPLAFPRLEAWGAGAPAASELMPAPGVGPLGPEDGIPVLTTGRAVPMRLNRAVVSVSLPVDVTSRLERLLAAGLFDVVHVHEPAAPSLSFSAVALARNPVVATFHFTAAGLFSYERSWPFVQKSLDRIDRSLVPSNWAAGLFREFLGGECRVVALPSAVGPEAHGCLSAKGSGEPGEVTASPSFLYVYRGNERRSLALFLRLLARRRDWEPIRITVAVHRTSAQAWPPPAVPRRLAGSVTWVLYDTSAELNAHMCGASALVLPFLGGDWLGMGLEEALAARVPVIAPDLPICRDILGEGAVYFSPDREDTVIEAFKSDAWSKVASRAEGGFSTSSRGHGLEWGVGGPGLVSQYLSALLGRAGGFSATAPRPRVARSARRGRKSYAVTRLATKHRRTMSVPTDAEHVLVDLHVHTAYSKDCASSVPAVLKAAREVGLGAIAIADHNTIAGALAARSVAGADLFVIVAEEIKTKQGEVIGLFLEEEVPAGLDFDETLDRIKSQGALVYIPHPFDGLHATPPYQTLVDNVHRIDVVEVFNARLAVPAFNVRAERFAAKYNIAAGAGSDAHVLQGLGTAMMRMRPFSTPEEFMESLKTADILAARKNVLYLTSLKLLQTSLDRVRSTATR